MKQNKHRYTSSAIVALLTTKEYNESLESLSCLLATDSTQILAIKKGVKKINICQACRIVEKYPELANSIEEYEL